MDAEYPLGAYEFIRASKPVKGSHVMVWKKTESGIRALNPQNERSKTDDYLETAVRGSIRRARIDGFQPRTGVKLVV